MDHAAGGALVNRPGLLLQGDDLVTNTRRHLGLWPRRDLEQDLSFGFRYRRWTAGDRPGHLATLFIVTPRREPAVRTMMRGGSRQGISVKPGVCHDRRCGGRYERERTGGLQPGAASAAGAHGRRGCGIALGCAGDDRGAHRRGPGACRCGSRRRESAGGQAVAVAGFCGALSGDLNRATSSSPPRSGGRTTNRAAGRRPSRSVARGSRSSRLCERGAQRRVFAGPVVSADHVVRGAERPPWPSQPSPSRRRAVRSRRARRRHGVGLACRGGRRPAVRRAAGRARHAYVRAEPTAGHAVRRRQGLAHAAASRAGSCGLGGRVLVRLMTKVSPDR